jgi:hypothetical protein
VKVKLIPGQNIRSTVTQSINRKDLFLWLSRGDLKAETESKIAAAYDQVL